jgi:hypothetical protein
MAENLGSKLEEYSIDGQSFKIPVRFKGKFVALINERVVAYGNTKEEAEKKYAPFSRFYESQPVYLQA